MRVFYNSILLATDNFTIGGGGPTADCGKPIAALTTSNTGRSVVFFPDALASNTPQQRVVSGLPGFGSGGPQGLAFYGADNVLVADAENRLVALCMQGAFRAAGHRGLQRRPLHAHDRGAAIACIRDR